jgi:NitT/TauT family transport system ATP-binding protein
VPFGIVAPTVEDRAQTLIEMKGVGKTYRNGTVAISNINLSVEDGEFLTLLGPSGCGKSTLLRSIAGFGRITQGAIEWSTIANSGANARTRLGFVFQEPTLMPWATVFENVYLPLRLSGVARRTASSRVFDTIEQVGLGEAADQYPRELSGGMKMRVSIARALVVKPRVLLMDEPFAALDEITRIKLNDDLLALWQSQQWTVIFVTHSVYESVYLSKRIVIMSPRPGRIRSEVRVPAPYPRDEVFRTSSAYNDLCRLTSAELKAAMLGE